jgi:hypothetical protein
MSRILGTVRVLPGLLAIAWSVCVFGCTERGKRAVEEQKTILLDSAFTCSYGYDYDRDGKVLAHEFFGVSKTLPRSGKVTFVLNPMYLNDNRAADEKGTKPRICDEDLLFTLIGPHGDEIDRRDLGKRDPSSGFTLVEYSPGALEEGVHVGIFWRCGSSVGLAEIMAV